MVRHVWPVPGGVVRTENGDFLTLREPTEHTKVWTIHGALDISLGDRRPHLVLAAAPGRVVSSTTETTYNPGSIVTAGVTIYQGRVIVIYLSYGHLSPAAVAAHPVGSYVTAGTILGNYASSEEIRRGSIKNGTAPDMAPHLHFEVRLTPGGQPGRVKYQTNFDPFSFLVAGRLVKGKVRREGYPLKGW